MCLPSRTILNPAFSNARTARKWGTPAILGNLKSHFDFPNLAAVDRLANRSDVFLDGGLNILERFFLGCALRPAAGQPGAAHAEALFSLLNVDLVFHPIRPF